MVFEHSIGSMGELKKLLAARGVRGAILKSLPKNANDKNQVYVGSDFSVLHPMFDFAFGSRGESFSQTKRKSKSGIRIPEAVFKDFCWLTAGGDEVRANNVKMIIYAQYPETRLSCFKSVDNTMPKSLSVEFTKTCTSKRILVLGERRGGAALALIILNPSEALIGELAGLPSSPHSSVCKVLSVSVSYSDDLKAMLAGVVGKRLKGCRYDADKKTLPFNGTQVCGYTLEHACGIVPNSDKDGDYKGIELKTHTQKKVTLFTPEPDMGLYREDFKKFMRDCGYQDGDGNWRLTGIHRAGERCKKSKLLLEVENYDPTLKVAGQMKNDIYVALKDESGEMVAGWSFERLLDCWGAKHNEVVYIPANKYTCEDVELMDEGYKFEVEFERKVLWCRETSADKLLQAICAGVVFLDPAPKLHATDPKKSKRRSQWRVNDIAKASKVLYEQTEQLVL